MIETLIEGSSKILYPHADGKLLMIFKDDIHGGGEEAVISGTGHLRKEFTYYFYRYLEKKGIATHLAQGVDVLSEKGIIVEACNPIKMEILVRNVARGHWVDEHKVPLFEGGQPFDAPIVEFCLKLKVDLVDGVLLDDPRINPALAVALHRYAKRPEIRGSMLLDEKEAETIKQLALTINSAYREIVQKREWILEDFKFEVATCKGSRKLILIDEISPDCSRIRDQRGNSLTKDLFRQRRPEEEVYQGYLALTEAVKNEVYGN